jgi:hypothetical protein
VVEDYHIRPPAFHWRRRKERFSAGSCTLDGKVVTVTAGTDRTDSRITILHELAHLILLRKVRSYRGEHSEQFYGFLWPLFRRYHIPVRAALASEGNCHRKTVLATYKRSGGRLRVE